jgi:HK97 gp10 family phage protein
MAETREVKGLRELRRDLKRLPKLIRNRVLHSALRAAAKPIVDSARARVPVKSGLIRRSIVVRKTKKQYRTSRAQVSIGVEKGRRTKGSKKVDFSDPFYWRFVEFGTIHQAAQPFLRPAIDAQKFATFEIFKKALKKGIEREARRL